ncbi:MAG: prohibitin family protein [Bacteroidetes bacterium]|nr:MAG: prohibitin family protein [Bacteroidota bacterium]
MNKSRVISTAAVVFIGFIVLILLTSEAFVTINVGEEGVLFHKFGKGLNKEKVYSQGFHIIAPWNTMYKYNVRIQEGHEEMDVLASNGLSISVDLSYRYSPMKDKIGYLHDEIGTNYLQTIIIPEIRSSTRQAIGRYTPEELYSTKRDAIQTEIFEETRKAMEEKYLILDAILIRSVKLPPTIKTAIESKLKQEQESQEYAFRIEKEQKEAERKRIEAEGIKQYQNIVSQSLSQSLLKWQGIEATKELANSPNTKVVIVGGGDSGLPLILGGN